MPEESASVLVDYPDFAAGPDAHALEGGVGVDVSPTCSFRAIAAYILRKKYPDQYISQLFNYLKDKKVIPNLSVKSCSV